MLKYCDTCGGMMLPKEDATCPSCGKDLSAASVNAPPRGLVDDGGESAGAGPGRFASWVRGKSMLVMGAGVLFVVLGLFGCSYQRRGRGPEMGGSDLSGVGIYLLVFGGILYGLSFLGGRKG